MRKILALLTGIALVLACNGPVLAKGGRGRGRVTVARTTPQNAASSLAGQASSYGSLISQYGSLVSQYGSLVSQYGSPGSQYGSTTAQSLASLAQSTTAAQLTPSAGLPSDAASTLLSLLQGGSQQSGVVSTLLSALASQTFTGSGVNVSGALQGGIGAGVISPAVSQFGPTVTLAGLPMGPLSPSPSQFGFVLAASSGNVAASVPQPGQYGFQQGVGAPAQLIVARYGPVGGQNAIPVTSAPPSIEASSLAMFFGSIYGDVGTAVSALGSLVTAYQSMASQYSIGQAALGAATPSQAISSTTGSAISNLMQAASPGSTLWSSTPQR